MTTTITTLEQYGPDDPPNPFQDLEQDLYDDEDDDDEFDEDEDGDDYDEEDDDDYDEEDEEQSQAAAVNHIHIVFKVIVVYMPQDLIVTVTIVGFGF